ncbi:MAG: DUF2480 family protein [Bacteroidetes bacterium]|nr:MAG: DUF2480 family protein [Bacteroidota bacterium]
MNSLSDKIAKSAANRTVPSKPEDDGLIVNRVENSAIDTFNLEDLWDGKEIVEFDFAPFLFQGVIVRERDFRDAVRAFDWESFNDQHVAIYCSVDTIIPTWAYMLIVSKLKNIAASSAVGRKEVLASNFFAAKLASFDFSDFQDRIVVIKGCNSGVVPVSAYADVTNRLQSVASKLMFGEACSSVPLWRNK